MLGIVLFSVKSNQPVNRSRVYHFFPSYRVERHAGVASMTGPRHHLSTNESQQMKTTANQLLNKAASHMQARAATYDKPEGERSMAATVTAYNAVTGQNITESHGWLLMSILKMVRDNQRNEPHTDSVEDLIAYSALYGEARLNSIKTVENINSAFDNDGWISWGGGNCPVDYDSVISVQYRDLKINTNIAGIYLWKHSNNDNDIIAYRVVK